MKPPSQLPLAFTGVSLSEVRPATKHPQLNNQLHIRVTYRNRKGNDLTTDLMYKSQHLKKVKWLQMSGEKQKMVEPASFVLQWLSRWPHCRQNHNDSILHTDLRLRNSNGNYIHIPNTLLNTGKSKWLQSIIGRLLCEERKRFGFCRTKWGPTGQICSVGEESGGDPPVPTTHLSQASLQSCAGSPGPAHRDARLPAPPRWRWSVWGSLAPGTKTHNRSS